MASLCRIRGSGLIAEVLAGRLWRPGTRPPVISPTIEVHQSCLRPREWGENSLRESCGMTIDHPGPHVLFLFPTSSRLLCTAVERARSAVLIHVSDQFNLSEA